MWEENETREREFVKNLARADKAIEKFQKYIETLSREEVSGLLSKYFYVPVKKKVSLRFKKSYNVITGEEMDDIGEQIAGESFRMFVKLLPKEKVVDIICENLYIDGDGLKVNEHFSERVRNNITEVAEKNKGLLVRAKFR